MTAPVRVIAVVGMVREARIIAGDGVLTVIGGGDALGLERKLEEALANYSPFPLDGGRVGVGGVGTDAQDHPPFGAGAQSRHFPQSGGHTPNPALPPSRGKGSFVDRPLLLSFGVCGALAPSLQAGDLLIASEVIAGGHVLAVDPDWTARLAAALPDARLAAFAGGDVMVGSAEAKQALYAASGAAAVDMESHVAARLALRHALPFAVVRTVSDAADHALPPAALAGLRPDGQPDVGAVIRALARRPSQLPALLRTAKYAELGFKALERATKRLRPAFVGMSGVESGGSSRS